MRHSVVTFLSFFCAIWGGIKTISKVVFIAFFVLLLFVVFGASCAVQYEEGSLLSMRVEEARKLEKQCNRHFFDKKAKTIMIHGYTPHQYCAVIRVHFIETGEKVDWTK